MTETAHVPVQPPPVEKQVRCDSSHFDVCPKCAFPKSETRPCLCDFS